MNNKHEFPKVIDKRKFGGFSFGYIDDAKRIVNFFSKKVLPLLEKFGLNDDQHVNRYLRHCTTFQDIYSDIVGSGGRMLIKYMVYEYESEGKDFYKPFRAEGCKAKTPEEAGFEWRKLPQATGNEVSQIVEGISYENGCFTIDKALFEKWSVIEPTDKQRELYALAAQFCEDLKEIGYDQRLEYLLHWDWEGNIKPNIGGIIWGGDANRHTEFYFRI